MSQWGEIEDINLVREKGNNKSKGFAFVKYEDQRSTILAVDNFNGIKLLGRTLRCDHCEKYKLPKEVREREEEEIEANPNRDIQIGPGHAYQNQQLANEFDVLSGQDLWSAPVKKAPDHKKVDVETPFKESITDAELKISNQKLRKVEKKLKKRKRYREEGDPSKSVGSMDGASNVVDDSAEGYNLNAVLQAKNQMSAGSGNSGGHASELDRLMEIQRQSQSAAQPSASG